MTARQTKQLDLFSNSGDKDQEKEFEKQMGRKRMWGEPSIEEREQIAGSRALSRQYTKFNRSMNQEIKMNYYQEVNGHLRLLALKLSDFKRYLEDVKNNDWSLSHVLEPERYFRTNNSRPEKREYLSNRFIRKLWNEIERR